MESFNLAVINKRRLFKNHLIRTWLDSIWGKCNILFFSGAFEPEGVIRLFFTGSGIGLRRTKNSELREREGGYGVLGYRFSFMVPLPFPTFLAPAWERNKKARGY
jgi:hypothetical protein